MKDSSKTRTLLAKLRRLRVEIERINTGIIEASNEMYLTARNAIRTRDANSIIDLLDSMEKPDWEHGTYVSFAGRIKNIWRRVSGEDSSPSLKEYFNKRTRLKGVKADLVVLDELDSIKED